MTDEYEEYLEEPESATGRIVKAPVKPMTDRDRLAEKLYVYYAYHNASDETLIECSKYAIKAAGIFFNQLEDNTESKGEKWGDQS